jgi:acetoacetyl-CoA synthetase
VSAPLWQPTAEQISRSQWTAFRRRAEAHAGRDLSDPFALHRWSIDEPAAFWELVWSFAELLGDGPGPALATEGARAMPGTRFFPEARLNFAENLLRRSGGEPALIFRAEERREGAWSWYELVRAVAACAAFLRERGVRSGDRVAGWLPNGPHAIAAMLACASVGAIWTSCSPDFGAQGVLDRFGQIEPVVLFAADGYFYNGRAHDLLPRLDEVRAALPHLRDTVVVPWANDDPPLARGVRRWDDALSPHTGAALAFTRLPFDHPLYVLYSSGTTGAPKCIVHGAGGTLLQHQKEQLLHVDLRAGERLFYFTTCGWMMWNWLASGLACGATLLLYDGSPSYPEIGALFEWAARERAAVFGTSAKFIDAVAKSGVSPRDHCNLSPVRAILSTGSPLSPEGFDFVYEHIAPKAQLASISGGTDIVSCFVLGCPVAPVWRGEIQMPGLGMAVDVFDDAGRPLRQGKGELVCTRPFPSMPTGFWNDPDRMRYRKAYFERFPGVWCHGDYAEWTAHGGMRIHGRSDAVLNPGGVRIGTAEIYRQVEQLDEVVESLVIAQEWEGDQRVVLFVRLRDGEQLDDALRARIRERVKSGASPRHVPARIVQVPDIPRTRSGKIVELAVRDVVHGRAVGNREALANPEALAHFAGREELAS